MKEISEVKRRRLLTKSIDKLMSKVFVDAKRKKNQRVVFYLRLYTDLVDAQACLNPSGYRKFLSDINRVKKFTRSCKFSDESKYTKKIQEILNSLTPIVTEKLLKKKKYHELEHLIKTRLKIAQSICVIRILALV